MGISTGASVTDDAAPQDLPQREHQPALWSEARSRYSRSPPQFSVAPALRTSCATTPERGLRAKEGRPCAHGCERKKHRENKLKPLLPTNVSLFPPTHPGLAARRPWASATPAPRGSSTVPVATLFSQQRSPAAAHAAEGLASPGSSQVPLSAQSK